MEFESEAPGARAASARRQSCKDLVLVDTSLLAADQEGRVDEADARAATKQAEQVGTQSREDTRHELDKAGIAHQVWKFGSEMHLNMLRVIGFEGSVLT